MNGDVLSIGAKLLLNGFYFQYLKRLGHPGRPQALSLEITHRCIAKCIMCNIWRIPGDVKDLPMERWVRLLSSDLFSDLRELDITGGEPFLRRDLPQLIKRISHLKQQNLPKLKSIAITTNALLTQRVLDYTHAILKDLERVDIDLVMVCAMDGIGAIHDEIRNHKDAWTKANETIERLVELRDHYPNLIIGLKTTILPRNVDSLEDISRYARQKGLFTIISPCIITRARYLNPERALDFEFTVEMKRRIAAFFETDGAGWSYHADALARHLKGGIMEKPCTCGFNYFFVRSTGRMLLCPLIDISPGNIADENPAHLFRSKKASELRKKIGKFPQCQRCTEPGLERYALPYEGFKYLSLLFKRGKNTFMNLHQHMGFEKFLG